LGESTVCICRVIGSVWISPILDFFACFASQVEKLPP
jgi:hypothetical protein